MHKLEERKMAQREGNRDRVFRAFRSEPVDRVPVGFWYHFLNGPEFNSATGNEELIARNVAGHKAFIDSFHPDFVKIMSDGFFNYPDGKGKIYLTPGSLSAIGVIAPDDPWVAGQADLVRRVTALQEDTAWFYNVFSPLNNFLFLTGRENAFRLLTEYPGEAAKALNAIAEGLLVLTRAVLDAGADGIYLSVTNPDSNLLSHDLYRTYVSPSEVRVLEGAAALGGRQILHICGFGGQRNDLSVFSEYPADVFNWATHVENISLARGKEIFKGKAVLGGFDNVPGSLIHRGAREEIESYTRGLLEETGTLGVIIGADCTIPGDTDHSHLEWVRETAAKQTLAAKT